MKRESEKFPGPRRKHKPKKRSRELHGMVLLGVDYWNSQRKARPSWQPNFEHLDFHGVDFADYNLSRAILRNANFRSCNLTRADLRKAVVTFTNFTDAILTDADLRGAKNLTKQQMESARDARGLRYDEGNFAEPNLRGDTAKVFLSYTWADKTAVLGVDQWLRDHGARVILDERNFIAGENIRDEILHWIREAGVIVCFISLESIDGPDAGLLQGLLFGVWGRGGVLSAGK